MRFFSKEALVLPLRYNSALLNGLQDFVLYSPFLACSETVNPDSFTGEESSSKFYYIVCSIWNHIYDVDAVFSCSGVLPRRSRSRRGNSCNKINFHETSSELRATFLFVRSLFISFASSFFIFEVLQLPTFIVFWFQRFFNDGHSPHNYYIVSSIDNLWSNASITYRKASFLGVLSRRSRICKCSCN